MMQKGDFTAGGRLLWISGLAVAVGVICSLVALVLLWLIGFFTNLFYFQQFSLYVDVHHPPSPALNTLGYLAVLVPVVGGLIIGLMARYGSDRIRGHGIPEAIEAILIGGSRMQPQVALLKPLSGAISIGSGGPFGAEGPIIMTGGAFGSHLRPGLSSHRRRTQNAARRRGCRRHGRYVRHAGRRRAAGRRTAALRVEAAQPGAGRPGQRHGRHDPALLAWPRPPVPRPACTPTTLPLSVLLCAVVAGLLAGALALFLTAAVYAFEDLFHRLPIHWMWWPALGGIAVGIGGLFQPRALGVGYDVIEGLLQDKFVLAVLMPLILVKCGIWSVALGSGTSGGVLAPLLIMGGALGAVESPSCRGQ